MSLIDPLKTFGISLEYWEKLEKGHLIQTKALDNYIRVLDIQAMAKLMKKFYDQPKDLP